MTMSPGRPSGFSRGRSDSPTLAPARLATLVGLVVVLTLGVLGGVGMVLVTQVMSLGSELPSYKDNIKEQISDLRLLGRSSGLEPVKDTVTRAAGEVERDVEKTKPPASKQPKPTPVVIQPGTGEGLL